MNEHDHTEERWQDAWGAGTFHAVFRLLAIADLYGPARAMEWAQSLVDDPELVSAYVNGPERAIAEIRVRRIGASDFPSFN